MVIIPDDNDVELFINTLKEHSCYDFSNYSPGTLKNKLSKILRLNNLSLKQLTDKIIKERQFTENIIKILTVSTTELFRDTDLWVNLRDEILPIFKENDSISLWHPGCSTGLEVYSMMMLLNELNMLEKSKIYATDINPDVLNIAKKGIYNYQNNKICINNFEKVINSGSGEKRNQNVYYNQYLTINKYSDELKMSPLLLKKPVFKRSDLIKDGNPFNLRYDLIVCRNVIIYYNDDLQNKLLNLFYRNLHPGGCLILGAHEEIKGICEKYFEKRYHVYFKKLIV